MLHDYGGGLRLPERRSQDVNGSLRLRWLRQALPG